MNFIENYCQNYSSLFFAVNNIHDKLLFLGHRSLIKKITQTAVINIGMGKT